MGLCLPSRVMTNEDWAAHVETSDEWIRARTGIRERRLAAEDESTADLAVAAARHALDDAGLDPKDLDEIIVATDTPEVYTPDTASFVQFRLGAREIPSYDLGGSGCAGFVLALDIARVRAIMGGTRRILVVGVELIMRLLDWTDRRTAVLFGDAAGAMIIGPGAEQGRILAATAGTDGSQGDILKLEVGGTRSPVTIERVRTGAHQHLTMEGRAVFREAVRRMTAAAETVLAEAGLAVEDLALVVPHQANARIIEAVRHALGLPAERVFSNVARLGNTGSASIPVALWEARDQGRLQSGDLVLLTAFGAGFHWSAMLLRW